MATRFPLVLNSDSIEVLQAEDQIDGPAIALHRNRITQSMEIPDGFNAVSYGPIEVLTGVTVRGLGNATWVGI